jgi:hypothetical protein
MRRAFCTLIIFMCSFATEALALSVGYGDSSLPFSVNYHPDVQPSFEPILEVVNDSNVAAVALSWQLHLEVLPIGSAHGELLFLSTSSPPQSLFGQAPGPMSDLTSPSPTLLASDSDTANFTGVEISGNTARNILQLTLQGSPGASGTFQLVMQAFDTADPNSSSWFPADGADPVAFNNAAASAFSGFVLLGSVNISPAFRPGDYDHDGVVGPLDYDRWRAHFSDAVGAPGDDADGNRNSVVDAADYVTWRANLSAVPSSGGLEAVGTSVPETGTATLIVIGLGLMACRRHQLPSRLHGIGSPPVPIQYIKM